MSSSDKLNIKFTARTVDAIEQARHMPIENVVADTSVGAITAILQHSLYDENKNGYGVSRGVAQDVIDQQLEERDRFDIMLDFTEELVRSGFLPRTIDVQAMRDRKANGDNSTALIDTAKTTDESSTATAKK